MADFDTSNLLADWNGVMTQSGTLTAVCGGVTFGGVWASLSSGLEALDEQLRNERRFTVFTTFTQLPTLPAVRQTVVRGGVTYFVEAVRSDAELAGIEIDVKQVL